MKEAIIEALTFLGGCGTISEVRKYIISKYGNRRKDIGTTMADLCPESKSSTYSLSDRILKRVGRGKYCLREIESTYVSTTAELPNYEKYPPEGNRLSSFSFRRAEDILKQKSQLSTIIEAASLTDLSSQDDHNVIQKFLRNAHWDTEISKFPVSSYRLDAFKDGTGIEIERSLIDAIHRSFFRCMWSYSKNLVDVLVLIVPTYKEPRFTKVKRDIKAFEEIIPFPVYLLGVGK